MVLRLSNLASARRLKTATGKDLLDYVSSEFDVIPDVNSSFSEGSITVGRLDATAAKPAGDYPKGTRFVRTAYTSLGIDFPSAEYESLADAHVELNSTDTVTIPIRATRVGAHANSPILDSHLR